MDNSHYRMILKGTFMQTICNKKYGTALKQLTNTEVYAFKAVLVFKLQSRKVLFINRKDNKNCQKVGYFFRK